MSSARRLLSVLKRFGLGIASGGTAIVAKSFEKEVRLAERDERRRIERQQTEDEA
jgi:hypothetical protein